MPLTAALERADILALIPHQGRSCLLDTCLGWTDTTLSAQTRMHLLPDNPLRANGRLGAGAGAEMAMQAAALHGALTAGREKAPGYLAVLRDMEIAVLWLDCPDYGALAIDVTREQADSAGMIYGFRVSSEKGERLLAGRGIVMFRSISTVNA